MAKVWTSNAGNGEEAGFTSALGKDLARSVAATAAGSFHASRIPCLVELDSGELDSGEAGSFRLSNLGFGGKPQLL